MVRKTKEDALKTRDQILDAAELVFNCKGVSSTTLADIAATAGVTRGAIYWHFTNKTDVFNAMFDRVRLPLEEMTIANAAEQVADPLKAQQETLDYLFQRIMNDPHYRLVFDILFNKCEFVDAMGPILERDATVRQHFRDQNRQIFANAVRKGLLPATTDVKLVVETYQALVKGILRNWLLDPEAYDLVNDGRRMVQAFFEMLKFSDVLTTSYCQS